MPNHQLAPCAVPALLPHHPGLAQARNSRVQKECGARLRSYHSVACQTHARTGLPSRAPAVTRCPRCPTPAPLRRGGHASASVASCRPAGAQGYRLPARSSILRTTMTDTHIHGAVRDRGSGGLGAAHLPQRVSKSADRGIRRDRASLVAGASGQGRARQRRRAAVPTKAVRWQCGRSRSHRST